MLRQNDVRSESWTVRNSPSRRKLIISHENIIAILDIILPKSYADFHEVYLVQELMETDL